MWQNCTSPPISHTLYMGKKGAWLLEDENFERWSSMGCFYQLMLKWHIKDFFPPQMCVFWYPLYIQVGKMFYVSDNSRVKVSLILCSTWHNGWSSNAWDKYHHHLASVIKNTLQEMGKKCHWRAYDHWVNQLVGTPVPDPESAGMPLTSPMLQTCDKEKVVWECYNWRPAP